MTKKRKSNESNKRRFSDMPAMEFTKRDETDADDE